MNIEKQQQEQMFYAKMAGLSYIIFTLAGFINSFYLNSALSSVELVKVNGICLVHLLKKMKMQVCSRWHIFIDIIINE